VTGPLAAVADAPLACRACGRHGTWDPARQTLACQSCGTAIDAGPAASGPAECFEFIPLLRDRPDSGRDWQPGATLVRCRTCGAPMDYPAYLAGRNCEACGSPTLVPCDATGAPVHPSGVVPFALTEAGARDAFAGWMATRRPIGSRRRAAIETMRAVYLPCWTFSAKVRVSCR
jgi:DNA-directed RNA polymerase subunit RPC12/RpoP